jgi:hypothetical protein
MRNSDFPLQQQAPKRFDNEVHYTAFFCKMELNMHERCNIWIKVHAGDYDVYSKEGTER